MDPPVVPSIIKGARPRGRPRKAQPAAVKFAPTSVCHHRRAFITCIDSQCVALCGDCGQEELIC